MPTGQSPSSNSIIVGNCVSCEGLVRVSSKTKANANVRCPHCQHTFSLAALLESAVPEVEIIPNATTATATPSSAAPAYTPAPTSDPVKRELYIDKNVETGKDASGKFVVPSQLAKGARRRKSSRRSGSSSRDGSRSSSRRSDSESSSRRNNSESSSRHRDSESSSRRRDSESSSRRRDSESPSRREGSRDPSNRIVDPRPANRQAASEVRPTEAGQHTRTANPQARESSERSEGSNNSVSTSPHRSTRYRDRRALEDTEPNPAAGVLKIIAGAFLALPIAYLIVMWVFGLDPLGFGKNVGESMPFVVPSSLRADDDSDSPSDDDDSLSPEAIDTGFSGLNIGEKALKNFGQ